METKQGADPGDEQVSSYSGPVAIAVASAGKSQEESKLTELLEKLKPLIEKILKRGPLQAVIYVTLILVIGAAGFLGGRALGKRENSEQKLTVTVTIEPKSIEALKKENENTQQTSSPPPQTKTEVISVPQPIIIPQQAPNIVFGQIPNRDAGTFPVPPQAVPLPEIPSPPDIVRVEPKEKGTRTFSQQGQTIEVKADFSARYDGVAGWRDYCLHLFDARNL